MNNNENQLPLRSAQEINNLDYIVIYDNYNHPNNGNARKVWQGKTDQNAKEILKNGFAIVYEADVWNGTEEPVYNKEKRAIAINYNDVRVVKAG